MSDLSLWNIESALHELLLARDEALDEREVVEVEKALAEYVNRELSKVDNIRHYLQHCRDMQYLADQEMDRQRQRKGRWESHERVVRRHTIAAMQAAHKKRLEGRSGELRVVNNGGKTPVVIDCEADVPFAFRPQVITFPINKDLIRDELEAGRTVKGAHLGERGVHLEIR